MEKSRATKERDFGQSLKLIRCWMGLSQDQLAKVLHYSKSTIRAYEGAKRVPTTKQVMEMAETLNVPFEWLCGLGDTFAWEANCVQRCTVCRGKTVK